MISVQKLKFPTRKYLLTTVKQRLISGLRDCKILMKNIKFKLFHEKIRSTISKFKKYFINQFNSTFGSINNHLYKQANKLQNSIIALPYHNELKL